LEGRPLAKGRVGIGYCRAGERIVGSDSRHI
jgi:hypothetical protein